MPGLAGCGGIESCRSGRTISASPAIFRIYTGPMKSTPPPFWMPAPKPCSHISGCVGTEDAQPAAPPMPFGNEFDAWTHGAAQNAVEREIIMPTRSKPRVIHPWPLRLTHWLNALAIVMIIGSGWQIYDTSPLFGFHFPRIITIGGWLGAAVAWHLACMWLLVNNGLIYFGWSAGSGHFRRFFPISPRAVWRDLTN